MLAYKKASSLLNSEQSEIEESKPPEMPKDLFGELEKRKKRGMWDGEVERHEIKEHNITTGKHYYVLDQKKREVVCTSCPVRHGGILEAKHLMDYKVEDGVLFFKGKACNETP